MGVGCRDVRGRPLWLLRGEVCDMNDWRKPLIVVSGRIGR